MQLTSNISGVYIYEAKYHQLYSFKESVYLWYYPLQFRYFKKEPDEVVKNYFKNDYDEYCSITSSDIIDKSTNQIAIHKSFNDGVSYNLDFESILYTEEDSRIFFESLKLLSFLGKPLYIGMSSRNDDSGLSKRIEEHLKKKTGFSKQLDFDLSKNKTLLNIENMIIVSINIAEIVPDRILESLSKDYEISMFLEKLLIQVLNPKYNKRI